MIAILLANFLMFLLFGAGLYFGYRYAVNQINSRNRIIVQQMRKQAKAHAAIVENLSFRVTNIELVDRKKMAGADAFSLNKFKALDERHNEQLKKIVQVNGEDVLVG